MSKERKAYKAKGFTHVVLVSLRRSRWVYPRGGGDDYEVDETLVRSFYVPPHATPPRVIKSLQKAKIITKDTTVKVEVL